MRKFHRIAPSVTLPAAALALAASMSAIGPPPPFSSFHVEVVGRGRPMILIPGLSSSGDVWKTAVDRYRDRFACHILTLAGFAGVRPIERPLLHAVRSDLVEYIRREGLERPVVIGHGLGGTLALAVAVDHPELLGSLVIVDGLPFLGGPTLQAKDAEEARSLAAMMRESMNQSTNEEWTQYVRSEARAAFLASHPVDLEAITRWGLASDRRTVTDAMADLYALDLREDLTRITAPTLVIGTWITVHEQQATNGVLAPRSNFIQTFSDQFAKLPRLHFVLSETSRHFIMLDEPQWFFAQLDRFLSDPEAVVRTRGFDAR